MIYIALYLGAIVGANLSVAMFGASSTIINAALFIGLDLTMRDKLHDYWQGKHLIRNMLALIATGSALSYALNANAGMIALASFLAFMTAALADTIVYTLLQDKTRLLRINGSNLVSSAIDSLIFPLAAFGLPIMWHIVLGQFLAKVIGGFVWSFILGLRHD